MNPPGSPGERLVRGAGHLLYGSMLSRVVSLGVSVLCARLLTEEMFGGFGMVQSTLGLVGLVAGLSLGMAATKFVAQYRQSDPERARRIGALMLGTVFLTSAVAGIFLLVMGGWIATNVLGHPELEAALGWGAMLLVASTCFGVTGGILSGTEDFATVARASILLQLLTLIACALLAPTLNLNGVVIGHALGTTVATGYCLFRLPGIFENLSPAILRRSFLEEFPGIIRFCVPVLGAGLVVLPVSWACLRGMATEPSGLVEVAAYTAAERIRSLLQFVAGFISTALFPIFADAHGRATEDTGGGAREIELAIAANAILILPLVAILAFGSEFLMGLFGRSYAAHWQVALLQIAAGAIGALGGAIGIALVAGNMQWLHFLQQTSYGVALFAIFFLLTDEDAMGLAFANLVSVSGLVIWSIPILLRRNLLTRRATKAFCGAIAATVALCGMAAYCPGDIRPLVGVMVAASALIIAPIVFLSKSEFRRIKTLITLSLAGALRPK